MNYRYNYLNNFLKNKFGERVLKICVDGGFTCPNRDGTCGVNGCIFCNARGSGERIDNTKSIKEQVLSQLEYKKEKANKFIVYFQNFSNTYGAIEKLKEKYDQALCDNRIVGLAIATRPDCLNEENVKLIKSYSKKYYVWVELGLQTVNDKISEKINKGYDLKVFEEAVKLLNKYEIDVVAHIMVGLPGEKKQDIIDTVDFINNHKISGIKIHSTYIVKNTKLAQMYERSEYEPISFEYYMENLIYIITHLKKEIVIHRFTGDPPKDELIAPMWELHKKKVMNTLNNTLEKGKLYQGICC